MINNKKDTQTKGSVILYQTQLKSIMRLKPEQQAAMVAAIYSFNFMGEETTFGEEDIACTVLYEQITDQITRDKIKYEQKCEKARKTAINREKMKKEMAARTCTNVHKREPTCTNSTDNDNDTDNDNEDDTDNETDNETDKETDNETDIERDNVYNQRSSVEAKAWLTPEIPTVEMVKAECEEKHYNVDPVRFIDVNQSRGWMSGNTPIRDWKALLKSWNDREQKKNPSEKPKNRFNNFQQRDYSNDDLERLLLQKPDEAKRIFRERDFEDDPQFYRTPPLYEIN